MAIQAQCGFETFDLSEVSATTGTVAYDGTITRGSDGSVRCNPTTTNSGAVRLSPPLASGTNSSDSDYAATSYFKVDFYAATLPAANNEPIMRCNGSGNLTWELRISSGGILSIYDNTPTLLATGTIALVTGRWYCVELKMVIAVSGSYEVRVNGVQDITWAGDNTGAQRGRWTIGKGSNRNGQTVDFYFDNAIADDSDWVGESRVRRMDVDGNGSSTAWTNDYTTLDEWASGVTASTDNTFCNTSTSGNVELASLETGIAAGISGKILCVSVFGIFAENATFSSAFQIRLRSASTNSDTTNSNLSTTLTSLQKLHSTDPATGANWTNDALNSVEVGGEANNSSGQYNMHAVCVMVSFRPTLVGQEIRGNTSLIPIWEW